MGKFESRTDFFGEAGLALFGIALYAVLKMLGVGEPSPPSHDEIMNACRRANQSFVGAREPYQKFLSGELRLYSDPAISSLEEMALHELYDCESIGPGETYESVKQRFSHLPLIYVR